VKFGTLFVCVTNILKETKCKAEWRKVTQWGVFNFVLLFMSFKLQEYSLCGRIYWVLRNSLRLWTRKSYIKSWSSKRVALFYTVAICGLITDKDFGYFKLVQNIPEDLQFFLTGGFQLSISCRLLINTSLTHKIAVWRCGTLPIYILYKVFFLNFITEA